MTERIPNTVDMIVGKQNGWVKDNLITLVVLVLYLLGILIGLIYYSIVYSIRRLFEKD